MKAASIRSRIRSEFAPPASQGLGSSFVLAVLAHLILLVILGMGVEWKHHVPPTVVAEAELWSELPQQAAPPPPPPPSPSLTPPVPEPVSPPRTPPKPLTPAPQAAPTKPIPNPAIALAKERKAKEEKLAKEAAREADLKAAAAKERKIAEEKEKEKEKEKKDKREKETALDNLIQQKTTRDKKQREEAENKKITDSFRTDQITRMMTGNGDNHATGTSKQPSGPSANYAGRIRARIKPNITYTETISGNPIAEVLVHIAPDGTILNRRLSKSSGVKSWDTAVLNAIDKTEVLPVDVDGRVQAEMVISFRPKD
ncbi:MAG: cell envelope integrity protein TolA [Pseudomonadota bacterium]|jgi:colicin import membrane protein